MLRLLAGLVVMAASILIGYSLSARLSRRSAVLNDYISLLHQAADRMTYSGENLAAVFSDNFAGFRFLPGVPFAQQWDQMSDRYRDVLHHDDREVLSAFGAAVGSGDIPTELSRIRLYQSLLGDRLTLAREANEKKGALYRVLPFSIGLALTILIL